MDSEFPDDVKFVKTAILGSTQPDRGRERGRKLLVLPALLIQVTMEGKTMLVEFEIKTETFILMYERVVAQFSL